MNKDQVSIIIPAYNAARRIEQTIKKLQEQTYSNFEIIIVNDGSKDGTEFVCSKLKERYRNVRVVTQENNGPGKAREKGVSLAQGEYIAFVDSDDYLAFDALKQVIRTMNAENADIVQFGYQIVDDGGMLISSHPLKKMQYSNLQNSFGYFIAQKNCTNFLCNKVYKYTLFHNVKWPKLYYSEDYAVLAQLYGKADKVITIESLLYYYVQHDENATKKPFSRKTMDQITAGQYVVNYTRSYFPEYLPEALYYLATHSARLAVMAAHSELTYKNEMFQIAKHTFKSSYSEMQHLLRIQKRKLKLDRMVRIFAICPSLAVFLKG